MNDVYLGEVRDTAGHPLAFYLRQFPPPFPPLVITLFVCDGMPYHALTARACGFWRRTVCISGKDLEGRIFSPEVPMPGGQAGDALKRIVALVTASGAAVVDFAPRMLVYCPLSEEGVFQRIEMLSSNELMMLKRNLFTVGLNAIFSRDLAEVRSDYIWLEHIYEQMRVICQSRALGSAPVMQELMAKVLEVRPKLKAKHDELSAA